MRMGLRHRISRLALVLAFALGVAGVGTVSVAPIALGDGYSCAAGVMKVVLYSDDYYTGSSYQICKNINILNYGTKCMLEDPDFDFCILTLNDQVTSIKAYNWQSGWRFRLYHNKNYGGCYWTFSGTNVPDLNDKTCAGGGENYGWDMNDISSSSEWFAVTS